jgi:hypothetical protein
MNRNTSTRRISPAKEKVLVLHDCTQVDSIKHLLDNTNKLSIIITGNGDPEKGLCRKVAIIAERQDNIFSKLTEIHGSLNEYHKETKEAKDTALTVKSAFDKYEAEASGIKKGQSESSTQGQVKFNNIITVVSTLLVLFGLIISVLVGRNERKNIEKRIDNFGTPVILNSRGQIDQLPAGDSLKFFRDGEFKSTYKDTTK